MAAAVADDPAFPCALNIHIPFPTHRLAQTALRTLSVDQELSPLVRRSFQLLAPPTTTDTTTTSSANAENDPSSSIGNDGGSEESKQVLHVLYTATTNRMLRVAVNGFFESLGVVLGVMEELDVDVLHLPGKEDVRGAQGLMTMSTS